MHKILRILAMHICYTHVSGFSDAAFFHLTSADFAHYKYNEHLLINHLHPLQFSNILLIQLIYFVYLLQIHIYTDIIILNPFFKNNKME